ncbi:outer membrane protein assembly factor BamA [bacterium]|nr:outer membrane protein assembly factor BamA [bacterium]
MEGPRHTVHEAALEGNLAFDRGELMGILAQRPRRWGRSLPFDRHAVAEDRRRLGDYYRAHGFLVADVTGSETLEAGTGRAAVHHHVTEGPRYRLGRVDFSGAEVESASRLLELTALSVGGPYNPIEVDAARARLLDHYRNLGYAYADVSLSVDVNHELHAAAAGYQIVEGTRVFVGDVILEGYDKTRPEVIRRRVTVEPGEPYSRRELYETRRDIFALGLFSSVTVEAASPMVGEPTADVRVAVEEGRFARLRLGGGYATLYGPRASAEAAYSNLFGRAHALGLLAEVSDIGDEESLYYQVPRFLGSGYDLKSELYHRMKDEPSFDVERMGGSVALHRRMGRRWTVSWKYSLEDLSLSDVSVDRSRLDLRESEGMLSKLAAALVHDARDLPLDPHRGSLSRLEVELAGGPLVGDFDFVTAACSRAWFLPTSRSTTLALYGEVGWLEPYGRSEESPLGERFLLGGDDTLRGFERDKVGPRDAYGKYVGGDAMLLLSAEYRFPVYKRLRGAVFYDTGNVWEGVSQLDPGDLRQSAGAGLRFISPVAAIRVDAAVNLEPKEHEDDWRLHFSIGHAF